MPEKSIYPCQLTVPGTFVFTTDRSKAVIPCFFFFFFFCFVFCFSFFFFFFFFSLCGILWLLVAGHDSWVVLFIAGADSNGVRSNPPFYSKFHFHGKIWINFDIPY